MHYLVIPVEHIPTVKDLKRSPEDFSLVSHMLNVGQSLLRRDAPHAKHYRFGFHQSPFNRWKAIKYFSLGPFGGFIEAEKLLDRIKPLSSL
ncbi:Bifunctional adenosine 5'-phosphosulfate phosphorylase/adenylylsulfatase hint4 [Orobanche gracilis]